MKIQYSLHSNLVINGENFDLEPTLALLKAIEDKNNLRAAASYCGYSYRKAWNLLNQMKELFGLPLVEKQRGKGTKISELGKKLIDIAEENNQNLNVGLTLASHKANEILQTELVKSQALKIVASDSEKINKLGQHPLAIEIHIDGSERALAVYAEKKCDIAGFHIAPGGLRQLAEYTNYLDRESDHFFLLEQRQQGIISHPDNPINSFKEIENQALMFVNRQAGSGTRLLLDNILKQQNIDPKAFSGYHHEEHTHLAVATMVASRQADAGLGIESAAKRLNLHFSPITSEYYFLVFKEFSTQIRAVLNILSHQKKVSILEYKEFINLIAK